MKSLVVCIGVVLTIACLLLYIFEPHLITAVSQLAYDALLEFEHEAPRSGQVAVVDLDERSLTEFGQWPWPRYLVADLTQRILDADASVVAFDVVFAEADRTSPAVLTREMRDRFGLELGVAGIPEELKDFDRLFARTLAGGRTVLGCYMHEVGESAAASPALPDEDTPYRGLFYSRGPGDEYRYLLQADGITLSVPALSHAAGNNAFFNTKPDFDGLVRTSPLVWAQGNRRIYPSLALEAARMHLEVPRIGIEYEEGGITALRLDAIKIPTDARGRILVNYRSSDRDEVSRRVPFPTYAAADVLSGVVGEDQLAGKVVLVGTSAAGLHDLRATPLCGEMAGVQIHATIVDNILTRDFLIFPRWMKGFDFTAIVFMGLFLTVVIHKQRSWLCFVVTMSLVLLSLLASVAMLRVWHHVFIPTRLIVSVAIIYPVLTTVSYWRQERLVRWTRSTFGAMVSDKVLSYLEENPDMALEGRKTSATVLFSDVRGFTRVAESLTPDELSDLMNRYLSPMTRIITKRDGCVDKFVGDMIMAVWGVPYSIPDHAAQACLAALDQLDELVPLRRALKQRFGHEIHIRVGINTGIVTAGKMGTAKRFEYTVMGDAVNLAARLEPLNKQYGTVAIIGEETLREAGDRIATRLLDRVVVAGKTRPVHIYELLGRNGSLAPEQRELAACYEQALRGYWQGDWEEALELLRTALRIDPADTPSARLRDRISAGHVNPVPLPIDVLVNPDAKAVAAAC